MTRWHVVRPARTVLAVLAIVAVCAMPAAAGELKDLDSSLNWLPADAGFYSGSFRCGEQFEAIAGSRAWAKIREMPVVKMGLQFYQTRADESESNAAKIETALENSQVQQGLALLADMFSRESFVYGDKQWVDAIELLQRVTGAMRYGPVIAQLSGEAKELDENDLRAAMLLAVLSENVDLLKVPAVIAGFKMTKTDEMAEHLSGLAGITKMLTDANPLMAGRFKRTQIGEHSYLVLSLDGKMIPWDEVPLEKLGEFEENPGDVDKLVAKVTEMTLVIALGLRDDYLLVGIGPSTDFLAELGSAKALVDRPELKRLDKFADKRIASIGYVSKAMNDKIAGGKKDIDQLFNAVDEMLPLAKLNKDEEAAIRKDLAELSKDIERLVPKSGAAAAVSMLTDRGMESYSYNWGNPMDLDGSKPLGLLEHLGGRPLAAFVARGKSSPKDYDLLVKWLKVGYGYFEKYGLPQMDDDDRERFEKLAAGAAPLVARLDKTTRDLLVPATRDGQAALVIDAKLTSKQPVAAMPALEESMPLPEPALVIGLSDAKLFRQALVEYWAILEDALGVAKEVLPDFPDNIELPEPQIADSDTGEIFAFDLPPEAGVDKQIVPNLGLGKDVAVISASRQHTRRLLKATPLAIGGLLVKTDRPLANAAMLDWATLVKTATPWIDLATREIAKEKLGDDAEQLKGITEQVHTVLEVLKVIRTITSEAYFDGDVLVQHTLVEIRDIEE